MMGVMVEYRYCQEAESAVVPRFIMHRHFDGIPHVRLCVHADIIAVQTYIIPWCSCTGGVL